MALPAACSALLVALCLPQGGGNDPPLLTPAEQKSLHDKLAKMIEARLEYDHSSGRNREKASRAHRTAKKAFDEEWESRREKKGDLLKSVADLRAIFDNCLPYERRTGTSVLRREEPKEGLDGYSVWVPRGYKQDTAIRTVLLVPGIDDRGKAWQDSRTHFAGTWEGSAADKDTLFHILHLPEKLVKELDRLPDYSKEGEDQLELERNRALLGTFGETVRGHRVDRERTFLDCGRESSGFGLRLAAHFPDLFAGVILRWPVDEPALRLGSLTGMPVLLVSSQETKEACAKLKERLDALQEGACTVVEAGDAYPFKGSAAAIEQWMAGTQRKLIRDRIVLEPNNDRWGKAFWVKIGSMEQIHTAPADRRPRLEIRADRAVNRIEVQARGIGTFTLFLNDALADLDKPVSVVVNGKAITEQRLRNFNVLLELVLERFDDEQLFPVTFDVRVPKEEKPASDGEKKAPGDASGGGNGK